MVKLVQKIFNCQIREKFNIMHIPNDHWEDRCWICCKPYCVTCLVELLDGKNIGYRSYCYECRNPLRYNKPCPPVAKLIATDDINCFTPKEELKLYKYKVFDNKLYLSVKVVQKMRSHLRKKYGQRY